MKRNEIAKLNSAQAATNRFGIGMLTPTLIVLLVMTEIIDAEQNPELVKQYGIRQAPTLVITDGAKVRKYVNASNIQKYVDEELD